MSGPGVSRVETALGTVVDGRCHQGRSRPGAVRLIPRDELVFVRRGAFQTHAGRRTLTADPGSVVAVAAGTEVRLSHPADQGDSYTALELSPDLSRELAGGHSRRSRQAGEDGFPTLEAPVSPELLLSVQILRRRLAQQAADNLALEESMVRLAEMVGQYLGRQSTGGVPARHPRVRRRRRELAAEARLALVRDPAARLSLGELAASLATSPFHLLRVFREEVGMPVHRYRLRLRLSIAVSRLAEGESDLSRLAHELGFTSHSHFTRVFRSAFGRPPAVIRRELSGA